MPRSTGRRRKFGFLSYSSSYLLKGRGLTFLQRKKIAKVFRRKFVDNVIMPHVRIHDRAINQKNIRGKQIIKSLLQDQKKKIHLGGEVIFVLTPYLT